MFRFYHATPFARHIRAAGQRPRPADLRCPRDASRRAAPGRRARAAATRPPAETTPRTAAKATSAGRTGRKAPAKKASPGQEGAPAKKAAGKTAAKKRRPARRAQEGGRRGQRPRRPPRRPPTAGRHERVHDVVVVGGGPGRLVVRLLAGRGRLGRGGGGEEGVPAGEDLRRRAHATGGAPAGRHGPRGRAGRLPPLQRPPRLRLRPAPSRCSWPEHPNFPDYGYTITRHDLDGLVAEHAAEAGATVLQGTEVTAPVVDEAAAALAARCPRSTGVTVKEKGTGATRTIKARYVVVADGSNSRIGRMLGTTRRRELPHGHGPARLLPLGPPRRPVHRVAPRHPRRRGQRGPRLRLDLPHGRRPGQRRRRPALHRPALEGHQHHPPHGRLRRTTRPRRGGWPRDQPRAADRRQAPHGPLGRAPRRRQRAHGRRRRRGDQPLQRRGHRLRLRDGPAGRGRPRPRADRAGASRPGRLRPRADGGLRAVLQGGPGLRPPHLATPRPCGSASASACARSC